MGQLHAIAPRLAVADLDRSFEFYTGTLGFEGNGSDVESGFVIVSRDAVELQLIMIDEHHPSGKFTVWLSVEDAVGEFRSLGNNVEVEWGPEDFEYGRTEFAVLDPDGHRLIFSSPLG